jgi:uncharacterized protein (UPF0303 family)
MDDFDEILKELEEQEKTLCFNEFTPETALEVGLNLVDRAKRENKAIAIDITKHGHQLFHYAFEGTSPDNDQWIARKNRVVNRFYKSSLYMHIRLKKLGKSIEEKYNLSSYEYAPYGGAFPIIVRNVGAVGTITVSGLTQEEDHEIVVWVIGEYLKRKENNKNGK